MQWIKAVDGLPGITKYYQVRNWITTSDGASVYCDSEQAISNYCKLKNFNIEEIEWLDENVPETIYIQTGDDNIDDSVNTDDMKVVSLFKTQDKIMGYGPTQQCYMSRVTHWMPLPLPPKP